MQPPAKKTREIAEQKASGLRDAMKDAAADVKRTLFNKLEAWELRAEESREEIAEMIDEITLPVARCSAPRRNPRGNIAF